MGALTQVTGSVRLVGAVTHIGTRHPMVLASMGQTLQALSGGRFVLGFGRGSAGRWNSYGVTPPSAAALADTADMLRRLWAGAVAAYDGPAGRFPDLRLMEIAPVPPPPMLLAGVGPMTLDLAGRAFDGAILHPILTADAVERSATRVRAVSRGGRPRPRWCRGARHRDRRAGSPGRRDRRRPRARLPARGGPRRVDRRGQPMGHGRARCDPLPPRSGIAYHQLKSIPPAELAAVSRELPERWLSDAAAVGSAEQCRGPGRRVLGRRRHARPAPRPRRRGDDHAHGRLRTPHWLVA